MNNNYVHWPINTWPNNINSAWSSSNTSVSNFNSLNFSSNLKSFKEKLEKEATFSKETKDFDIYHLDNRIYFLINSNIKNIEYVEEIISYIFPNVKWEYMFEKRVIYLELIIDTLQPFNRNNIQYIVYLGENFVFKEIRLDDFISTNQGIFFIGFDNILPKIKKYQKPLFLESNEGNPLKQDFISLFHSNHYDSKKTFVDEVSNKYYSYEEIPQIREWEKHIEEAKKYVR